MEFIRIRTRKLLVHFLHSHSHHSDSHYIPSNLKASSYSTSHTLATTNHTRNRQLNRRISKNVQCATTLVHLEPSHRHHIQWSSDDGDAELDHGGITVMVQWQWQWDWRYTCRCTNINEAQSIYSQCNHTVVQQWCIIPHEMARGWIGNDCAAN